MSKGPMSDNERAARSLGVKRDLKLKFAAMGVWWLVGIMFSYLVLSFVTQWSFLINMAVSLLTGFLLMLVFYYLVLPRLNREGAFYREILTRFNREGFTPELAAQLDQRLRTQDFSSNLYRNYYNNYLELLAVYNLNLHNYGETMRLLDSFDMNQMQQAMSYDSGRIHMTNYHYIRLITAAEIGDISRLEYYYGAASPCFAQCRGVNKLVDAMIDSSRAMREVAFARAALSRGDREEAFRNLDEADRVLAPYSSEPATKQDYCNISARTAALRGDRDTAERLFDEAYSLAKNNFQRETVLRDKARVLGTSEA
ncbi:hypothetical protein [Ruminococcus sp.]|uniref:hypothetical protein n=1 Tax=Ruminococcus sp. TaxID=41978 RepID=UPI0025E3980C|nr:hypothetical protein [Ruminococcus sp.]MBQ8964987.1 hypothetical protein [Ruminococcus sp.]